MATAMIEYALFLENWTFEDGDPGALRRVGVRVTPEEVEPQMIAYLFCPDCHTNLTRRPREGKVCRNQRKAYFAHLPKYRHIECNQRTPEATGNDYQVEEVALQAIERGDLVVVTGFLKDLQEAQGPAQPYAAGPVEDPEGRESQVPIARHVGDDFMVPGRNRTVNGICRRLDQNLTKYYMLPEMKVPVLLSQLLESAEKITGNINDAKLYFGKINRVYPHVNQTDIGISNNKKIKDLTVVGKIREVAEKGIHADSVGQYLLFWGSVTEYGIGYAVRFPNWGEYALVPQQYTELLDNLAAARP